MQRDNECPVRTGVELQQGTARRLVRVLALLTHLDFRLPASRAVGQ